MLIDSGSTPDSFGIGCSSDASDIVCCTPKICTVSHATDEEANMCNDSDDCITSRHSMSNHAEPGARHKDEYTCAHIRPRAYTPKRLWTKRDVEYSLDSMYCDRILNRFVANINTLKEKGTYDRSINEDAFYYNYRAVAADLETLTTSSELMDKIECKRLRTMSLQLIEYSMKFNRNIEKLIDMAMSIDAQDPIKDMIKTSIAKKKGILGLIRVIRNHISEIVLMGGVCRKHIDESNAIAFRGIDGIARQPEENKNT
ncbi:hypothetical protein HK407_04g07040 [Ordospora pajunii]|uniref:uncharacterized protein n=1 Tax=Ordospora pajunii TaxID=3039483 RepID=UPI0029528122|nr:uncharacterized protein HK407_04g07040 [Ordospora pajunii]KAH9411599.1 hypothetical protein HK407_04g07040 [Ordospora pajunii]